MKNAKEYLQQVEKDQTFLIKQWRYENGPDNTMDLVNELREEVKEEYPTLQHAIDSMCERKNIYNADVWKWAMESKTAEYFINSVLAEGCFDKNNPQIVDIMRYARNEELLDIVNSNQKEISALIACDFLQAEGITELEPNDFWELADYIINDGDLTKDGLRKQWDEYEYFQELEERSRG